MSSARDHALVICADPGIRWRSPKGASVHLRSISRGLVDNGIRVSILTLDGLAEGWSGEQEPDFGRLEELRSIRPYFDAGQGDRLDAELRALARNPWFFARALELNERDPITLIYERYSLWSDVGARLGRSLDVPVVMEVNAPLIREQQTYRQMELNAVATSVAQSVHERADRIVVVSERLGESIREQGVPADRVRVLPNVADRARFAGPSYRPPNGDGPVVVGFSGSLKPWHGLEPFLDVFAAVHRARPRVRLEILGDGRERAALEARVHELELDHAVVFLGHREHEEVPGILHGWHLTVAPYPPLEEFYFSPLKIAEALAAGLPVLASAEGDIPSMLGQGAHGGLLPAGDADAWIRAMIQLIDEPSRLQSWATAAATHTREWSWQEQARRSVEGLRAHELGGVDVPA